MRTIGLDHTRPSIRKFGPDGWITVLPTFDKEKGHRPEVGVLHNSFAEACEFVGRRIDSSTASFSCWGLKCYMCGYTQFFKHPADVFIVCCGCAETIYPWELA